MSLGLTSLSKQTADSETIKKRKLTEHLEDENENEVKVQKKEKKVDIPLNFVLKRPRICLTETSWVEVYSVPLELRLSQKEFEEMWALHPKEKGKVKIFGKETVVARWQQAFGRSYYYSGMLHNALPMPPILQRYLDWCKTKTPTLNGCLLNWYENGDHYIGPHSDSEKDLVSNSEIYSISFGATRDFVFEEKKDKKRLPHHQTVQKTVIPLENNTLVIMGGTVQKTHKHSVPKSKKISGRRINITFRSFKTMMN